MPELSAELKTRVAALVDRLHFVRADYADADAKSGRDALEETVEQELGSVDPAAREVFLKALAHSLILPEGKAPLSASDQVSRRPHPPEQHSADFLVSQLVDLARNITDAERQVISDRLAAAGFASAGENGLPAAPAQQLQTFLGHGSKDRLDPARTLELTRLAAEFVNSIDRSVSASWRAVAPNSRIRHTAQSRALMARFAAGDPEITKAQVQQELDRLRTLAGGLLSAVERAGEQFAQRHTERFSPLEIEAMARLIPGTFLAMEAKCWRKYKELAEHQDKAAIEQDIRSVIAEYTERLIEGLGR